MKSVLRRTAVVVLAIALSLPITAVAAPPDRDSDLTDRIVQLFKQIRKALRGVVTNDLPTPPHPTPPPPTTT